MKRRVQHGVVMLLSVSSVIAAEDTYLEAIEREAEKIDPVSSSGAAVTAGDSDFEQRLRAFERYLSETHHATFQLYEKLPQTSQREVFANYR